VPAGEGIVSAAVDHHPDHAVIDIDPPGVDGLTASTGGDHSRRGAANLVH
jgi:hypothetical protein